VNTLLCYEVVSCRKCFSDWHCV